MKKLFTLLALAGLMMAQAPVAVFAQDAEMEVVADSAATDSTLLAVADSTAADSAAGPIASSSRQLRLPRSPRSRVVLRDAAPDP